MKRGSTSLAAEGKASGRGQASKLLLRRASKEDKEEARTVFLLPDHDPPGEPELTTPAVNSLQARTLTTKQITILPETERHHSDGEADIDEDSAAESAAPSQSSLP
eukprot:TRINITY_DN47702_c0_g1_i1.p2 TRINITY_DN47702_c0_g1~~TRINITY_DN47702_c0_g1_i1.p2  ORF type:complete len:106 (+),score=25.40 TRINITY_DN47702_c0_g1_i1:43-360(+)